MIRLWLGTNSKGEKQRVRRCMLSTMYFGLRTVKTYYIFSFVEAKFCSDNFFLSALKVWGRGGRGCGSDDVRC